MVCCELSPGSCVECLTFSCGAVLGNLGNFKRLGLGRWVMLWELHLLPCPLLLFLFILFDVYVCFRYMYVCVLFESGTYRGQRRMSDCLRTGDTNGYRPLCGCWESRLGPWEEQQVLFIAKPSLQSLSTLFLPHTLWPPRSEWLRPHSTKVIIFCLTGSSRVKDGGLKFLNLWIKSFPLLNHFCQM